MGNGNAVFVSIGYFIFLYGYLLPHEARRKPPIGRLSYIIKTFIEAFD